MPNKNHSDKHRENFNSRHNCSEKKDKSKAGYWGKLAVAASPTCPTSKFTPPPSPLLAACKVWKKGFKA